VTPPRLRWLLVALAMLVVFGAVLDRPQDGTKALPYDFEFATDIVASGNTTCVLSQVTNRVCWGSNYAGQMGVFSDAPYSGLGYGGYGINGLSGGDTHFCGVDSAFGFRAVCWGDNTSGQLGLPSSGPDLCSVFIPCLKGPNQGANPVCADAACLTPLANIFETTAGGGHSCGLGAGQLHCWGNNGFGQLGDGTLAGKSYAVSVPLLNVLHITAGNVFTCALLVSGTVSCWGDNTLGQLGANSSSGVPVTSPVTVCDIGGACGALSNVTQISAGVKHACALLASGSVACWGANDTGQLGSVTAGFCSGTACAVAPQLVTGLTGVTRIESGGYHTCAIVAGGELKCWGLNNAGQLGVGTDVSSITPVTVIGLSSGVRNVTLGNDHTCAITASTAVMCWGAAGVSQLGDAPVIICPNFGEGGADCNTTPQFVGVFLDGRPSLSSVSVNSGAVGGGPVTVAVHGKYFAPGTIGQVNGADRPTVFVDATTIVVTVQAGDIATYQPISITARNLGSAVSNGRSFHYLNPIASAKNHACLINTSSFVECWGDDKHGQLGQALGGGPPSSTPLTLGLSNVVQVVSGDDFSCALDSSGNTYCWGRNDYLQMGQATGNTCFSGDPCSSFPLFVDVGGPVAQLAAGAQHACAVLQEGTVKCWGRGDSGQLGTGGLPFSAGPAYVSGFQFPVGIDQVSAGKDHTCFIVYSGHVAYCTGGGAFGQLGDGSTAISVAPGCVDICTEPYRYISAGDGFTCGITFADVAKCWGRNDFGQLGHTSSSTCSALPCDLLPVDVTGIAVGAAQIEAGGTHACVLSAALGVLCWGSDVFGQLGDGPPSGPGGIAKVQPIGLGSGVESIALGTDLSCAHELTTITKCWGLNAFGQLGTSTLESCAFVFCSTTPVVVGTLSEPAPFITETDPPSVAAMGPGFTLHVFGTDFADDAVVNWNGSPRTTTFVYFNQLDVSISAADIAVGAPITLTVEQESGTSNPWSFLVLNVIPAISTLSPATLIAGSGDTVITVTGTGFVPQSGVYFNGEFRPSTYISPTQVSFTATAADLSSVGNFSVAVFNPEPGGGFSLPANLPVSSLQIIGTNPSTVLAGSPDFLLSVSGVDFAPEDVIQISGALGTFTLATTFVNATTLTAMVPAAAVALSYYAEVTVLRGPASSAPFFLPVNNPVPTITSLTPTSALSGSSSINLSVKGTGFNGYSVVRWNGATRITSIVNSTELIAFIPDADVAAAGSASVTVFNPPLGGGLSNSLTFTISDFAITGLVPLSATAGDPGFTLTVNGTSFLPGDTVFFGFNARATTYVSATKLTAQILASDIAVGGGLVEVTVQQGSLFSSSAAFAVNNPVPTLASLSTNSVPRGSSGMTLTLTGTQFVNGSVVQWNGVNRSTSVINSISLTVVIPGSDFAAAGAVSVTVVNPPGGGGTSNALPFSVTNPAPTATLLTPSEVLAGFSGTLPISITGTNFVPAPLGSSVLWNGSPRATTFVSSTQIIAQITASDLAVATVATIQVFNPTPGGGTTASLTFTVKNAAPVISSLSPSAVAGGSPGFTLNVTGSGFVSGSVVLWNGSPRPTFSASTTFLAAGISTADVANAGVAQVTVLNPAPGGGTSSALPFSVTNPAPIATGLAPRNHIADGKAFTVIVRGSNFVTNAIATFRDSPRPVAYASATEIGVQLLPSDMASPGVGAIVVSNPAPGGGESGSLAFELKNAIGDVTTGGLHTCSLDLTNLPACWGQNEHDQLGFASSSDPKISTVPLAISGLTGVRSIAAGAYHTCALMLAGEVKCWGRNSEGQLGDGTIVERSTPTTVPNLTGVREIEAGNFHTCARTETNGVKCWGYNGAGQLGAASADTCGASGITFACSKTPLPVTGIAEGALVLAAGGDHTCALITTALNARQLKCWGANTFGELGNGTRTTAPSTAPSAVTGSQDFVDVAAGSFHTCAITVSAATFCWGSNGFGQLGTIGGATCGAPALRANEPVPPWASAGRGGARAPVGSNDCALSPVAVSGLHAVMTISGGFGHTCATTSAGAVYCWGWNEYGQLGDGTTISRTTPAIARDLSFAADTVSAGTFHTCAITKTGGLRCWGENFSGQLGEGTTQQRAVPNTVINQAGAPVLFSVSPSLIESNTLPVTVTIAGYGFLPGSVTVVANGLAPLTLSEVTSTSLKAVIPASVGFANLHLVATNAGYGDSNPLPLQQFQIISEARISGTATINSQPAPNGSVVSVRVAGLAANTTPPLATVSGGQFSFEVSDPTGGGFRTVRTADLFVDGIVAARNVPVGPGANTVRLFAMTHILLVPGAIDGTWFGSAIDPMALPAGVSAVFEWDNTVQRFAFWFRGFPASFQTLGSIAPGHHYFFQSQATGTLSMTGGTFALSQPGTSFSAVAGATGAHWTGNPQPSLESLPMPISAVFQWSVASQQFRFWFRGFPTSFNTLSGGLQYGSFYFFQSLQPVSVPLP
jgi:alpha-tubulin suppressor-like RCC1 family protein